MEIPGSTYYYKPKGDLFKKKRDADIADATSKSTKIPEVMVTKIPDPRTKKLPLITPFTFKIFSPVAGPLDIYDC